MVRRGRQEGAARSATSATRRSRRRREPRDPRVLQPQYRRWPPWTRRQRASVGECLGIRPLLRPLALPGAGARAEADERPAPADAKRLHRRLPRGRGPTTTPKHAKVTCLRVPPQRPRRQGRPQGRARRHAHRGDVRHRRLPPGPGEEDAGRLPQGRALRELPRRRARRHLQARFDLSACKQCHKDEVAASTQSVHATGEEAGHLQRLPRRHARRQEVEATRSRRCRRCCR